MEGNGNAPVTRVDLKECLEELKGTLVKQIGEILDARLRQSEEKFAERLKHTEEQFAERLHDA